MSYQSSNECTPDFTNAVAAVRAQVLFDEEMGGFYPRDVKKPSESDEVAVEDVENLLMDELIKTDLHYDKVGDEEFQRLLSCGMKSLDGSDVIEMEADDEYEEEEGEEEEEEEAEADDSPEGVLMEFIQELIEEARANSDDDEDEEYLEQRIYRGLKTREIQIQFRN